MECIQQATPFSQSNIWQLQRDYFNQVGIRLGVFLDLFLDFDRPKEYLFEGVDGGRYSSMSLRKVFERVLLASGV